MSQSIDIKNIWCLRKDKSREVNYKKNENVRYVPIGAKENFGDRMSSTGCVDYVYKDTLSDVEPDKYSERSSGRGSVDYEIDYNLSDGELDEYSEKGTSSTDCVDYEFEDDWSDVEPDDNFAKRSSNTGSVDYERENNLSYMERNEVSEIWNSSTGSVHYNLEDNRSDVEPDGSIGGRSPSTDCVDYHRENYFRAASSELEQNLKLLDKTTEAAEKKRRPRTNWIFLQYVTISQEHMQLIFMAESKTIDKAMYKRHKNTIAKEYIDPIVGCIALMKTYHAGCKKIYTGTEELTFWMYCQHLFCHRKFKMTCSLNEAQNGTFALFRSDNDQTHKKYLTRHVRQADRDRYAEELKKQMPMEFRRRNVDNATEELLEQKNLQDVKSDAVYRKIRHEALQKNDLHTDYIKDLEMMMGGDKAFVQKIIKKPFAVYIFSKSQCSVVFKLANDSPDDERVGHLDATGGVVLHPYPDDDDSKQIYYYACVMNIKIGTDNIGTLIPIFELVSECHDAVFLANWMFGFKTFFRANYPKLRSPFQRIVVDKSYALIHAVLEGFNDMDLTEYLLFLYDVVSGTINVESVIFKKLLKIHLCYTHLSKVFSKNILKAFNLKKHNDQTRFLKDVLQFLAKSRNYIQMKNAFHHLATLFVNEFHNGDVEYSYKMLTELLQKQNEKNQDNAIFIPEIVETQGNSEENEKQFENIKITDTIYNNSPFYHDFNNIFQERSRASSLTAAQKQKILKLKTKRNAFYNTEFPQTFAKNYLSILPMWSGLAITDNKIIVYHNQHVESNFRISKECFKRKPVELGKLPTKCGRFLRETIKRTERDVKAFKWDIGKFRLASNKPKIEREKKSIKRKRNECESDYVGLSDAQEKWMKKRPKMSKKIAPRKRVELEENTEYPSILQPCNYFEESGEIELKQYRPVPVSRKKIDLKKKLGNGLIEDSRYYKTVIGFNYVVAIKQKHRLWSEDFSCLRNTEWFSNNLIEYILQIWLCGSKNIEGSCIGADLVFLTPHNTKFYKAFRKAYVLLPLLDRNHFVLFILDIHEKIICYIDPKGEKQKDFEKYIENFKIFLAEYNKKYKSIGELGEWRVKKFEHNFQSDSVNCGPYVVRFCELFITKGEIHIEEFDPYVYRRTLIKMVLTTSELGMVDFCLLCGQNSNQTPKDTEWIECDTCQRWLHSSSCASVDINDFPEDVVYECPLCNEMAT